MLFLIQDIEEVDNMTPEELQKDIEDHTRWVEELAKKGQYKSGEPLLSDSRMVNASQIQSDGPYIESKEAISGYFIILADDIEAASKIAQTCPAVVAGSKMLVRPVHEL